MEAEAEKQTTTSSSSWSFRSILGLERNDKEETVIDLTTSDSTDNKEQPTAMATASVRSNESVRGYEVNRYQHDLEQAKAMRRAMNNNKKTTLQESDILLGLNGLDEADNFRQMGDYQQALRLSEMGIELLIQFLKSDKSVLPHVSRETISQRVQVALTDAEEIKMKLKSSRSANSSPQTTSSKSSAAAASSTRSALSEALSNAVKKTRPKPAEPKQSAGQSTSSVSASSVAPKVTALQNYLKQKQNSPPIAKSRSPLNSQDPMVQIIKSELYVDQSRLEKISWDDIAGLDDAKQALQENAILPLARPDLFTGLRKPRNILLYGPPGTGKTLLVKAVAKESQCILFICTSSSLTSKWLGEGEKLLRTLFEVARAAAPSIIFIDEMDALLSSRKSDGEHEASRRFKTEFMTQVDGIQKDGSTNSEGNHAIVIGCTNCPWDVDSAVLRRFPRRIFIPLPDYKARILLMKKLLHDSGRHQLSTSDLKDIIKKMHGFSGSDIASIASEASFGPIRSLGSANAIRNVQAKDLRPISKKDFDDAISQSTKSVSKKLLHQYDDWIRDQAPS